MGGPDCGGRKVARSFVIGLDLRSNLSLTIDVDAIHMSMALDVNCS